MKNAGPSRNQFKFRHHLDIGTLDAESDDFLLRSFVQKEELQLIRSTSSHKSILLGRTGSGKSAIIRYLENAHLLLTRIPPESISLRHLSNSNIIRYFSDDLGIKLDLFYKLLWKHVILVEILKLFLTHQQKKKGFMDWLQQRFPDKQHKRALSYLQRWEKHFWESTEYQVKELEASLENRFKEEVGLKIPFSEFIGIKTHDQQEKKAIEKIKVDVVNKAKKVVNESQMEEIDALFKVLKDDMLPSVNQDFYIVIDDLDKEWVANNIVYDLIRSLLDTIREFRQLPQLKIVVALRSNIHEVIFAQNQSRGLQREKFSHLYLNIVWTEDEIAQLLNNRLAVLMKGAFTNDVPTHLDVLPLANERKESGLKYMMDRSFMRPRDIIDYFNKCIAQAEGKTKITREVIKAAEHEYSRTRLQAIHDEWLENHGNIDCLFEIVSEIDHRFSFSEILPKAQQAFLEILAQNRHVDLGVALRNSFTRYGEDFDATRLLAEVLVVLYDVGLIGIKPNPSSKLEYSYRSTVKFTPENLKENMSFFVHPMFHRALRVHHISP